MTIGLEYEDRLSKQKKRLEAPKERILKRNIGVKRI
jgi:hypothetical protein